jgi:sporadic carbohydrate cluster protein (TIGR04323 family)
MKKNVRGYIFGKEFMGERVPQHIQNITIRDYCFKNNLIYNLSLVEYVFENSIFMLMEGVKELDNLYGIVMYSMFQLPENESDRKYIANLVIKKKKKFFFALENRILSNKKDFDEINLIWLIKKELPKCYKYNKI